MSDMVKKKNEALLKTVEVLQDAMTKVDDNLPPILRAYLRDMILDKIADLWTQPGEDFLNINSKILGLKKYTNKNMFFKFKLAECINYIKCMTTDQEAPLFNLN